MGFDRTFHAPRLGDTPSRDKQAAQSLARSILQGPNDLFDVKLEKILFRPRAVRGVDLGKGADPLRAQKALQVHPAIAFGQIHFQEIIGTVLEMGPDLFDLGSVKLKVICFVPRQAIDPHIHLRRSLFSSVKKFL